MPSFAFLFGLCIGMGSWAYSAPLTETQLLDLARQSSPQLQSIAAAASKSQMEKSLLESKYETRAQLSYDYSSSNEEGLASFIPVFSPTKNFSVGLTKPTPYGAKVGIQGYGESINTKDGTINNAARTGVQVSLELDLFKNFLGRLEASELKSQKFQTQRIQLQSALSKKEFELEVRKLYWSLIANEQSLKLSEQLVSSAQKQFRDASQRSRAGAADSGDVARNQALLQSRESSVYLFKYQREILESQLKQWVPALADQEIQVSEQGLDQTVRLVLSCVDSITDSKEMQESESDYFKIIALAEKQYEEERRKAKSTGDWDLKLTSYYRQSGVGQGFDQAYDVYKENAKDGYGVGVTLSIPLEGDIAQAEKHQKLYIEQQFQSDIRSTRLKLSENHKEVARALKLLRDAAKAQHLNVSALQTSQNSSLKKYRQARITLSQMIYEQDTLFNSQLQEIQTKLSVIHALLDYFKIFNNHSCSLNNKTGSKI